MRTTITACALDAANRSNSELTEINHALYAHASHGKRDYVFEYSRADLDAVAAKYPEKALLFRQQYDEVLWSLIEQDAKAPLLATTILASLVGGAVLFPKVALGAAAFVVLEKAFRSHQYNG